MISMDIYYDNKSLNLNYRIKVIFKFLNRILYLLLHIFISMWDVFKNYLTFKFSATFVLLTLMLHCEKIALSNLYIVTVLKNQFCVKKMRNKNIKGRKTKETIFQRVLHVLLKIYLFVMVICFFIFFNILNIIFSYVLIIL